MPLATRVRRRGIRTRVSHHGYRTVRPSVVLITSVAFAAAASPATGQVYLPEDNAGTHEYVLSVPTAGGDRPVSQAHARPTDALPRTVRERIPAGADGQVLRELAAAEEQSRSTPPRADEARAVRRASAQQVAAPAVAADAFLNENGGSIPLLLASLALVTLMVGGAALYRRSARDGPPPGRHAD